TSETIEWGREDSAHRSARAFANAFPRRLPPRGGGNDLGTYLSTDRVPSTREEDPRRLLVVSSDYRCSFRHSSVRWNAARLHRGHTPLVHDSASPVHRRIRSTRPGRRTYSEG